MSAPDRRLEELVACAQRLFPGCGYLLAIGNEESGTRIASHVPEELRKKLLKSFLFTFERESQLVITTVVVSKENPADEQKQEAEPPARKGRRSQKRTP